MGLGFVPGSLNNVSVAGVSLDAKRRYRGGCFYTYAPYHALDLYVRGALAEFFCFVFPAHSLAAKNSWSGRAARSAAVFSLSLGALILTLA